MSRFESSPRFVHGTADTLGVLLVNLGTPDAPSTAAVRRYLRQFLWDRRVVELPRPLWWLILNAVILTIRPPRTATAYRKIWTDRGSPLLNFCKDIAEGVQQQLKSRLSGTVHTELAMSYGQPSIETALNKLHEKKVRRVLLLPLYPQYSNTTTGSVFADVTSKLAERRWIPELRFINHYHDAPAYIEALAATVREHRQQHGAGEKLLFSFHGLPRKMLEDGDPYHCQCQKTARLVAESLSLNEEDWALSFQSRVGRDEWLRPYTDQLLTTWGEAGTGNIDVICPGFSADCLETLEEIQIQNDEFFREAGGAGLRYIPALNARPDHINCLTRLIEKHIAGWPEAALDWNVAQVTADLNDSARRAKALGAEQVE